MPDERVDRSPFHEWLEGHARGTLNDELTAALGELVEAVGAHEKPGKLTLTLAVDVAGSGGRTVLISGEVAVKAPKPAPEASIFYVGEAGTLHRDDPFAMRMPGVPFTQSDGEVRVVDPDTGEVKPVPEVG